MNRLAKYFPPRTNMMNEQRQVASGGNQNKFNYWQVCLHMQGICFGDDRCVDRLLRGLKTNSERSCFEG